METVDALKQLAVTSGADLVGVAPVERFTGAPAGHHPEDILPGAKTVIVCARRIPSGALEGPATAYHRAMEVAHNHLDYVAAQVALWIEQNGGRAVPVPADEPYAYWEAERSYGRGDLSHKHAAEAAGLGRLGKNSLLITPQFGNRVHLVSIVTNVTLPPDPVLDWEPCPKGCTLCRKACPAGPIGENQQVDQALCRPAMVERLPKGRTIESCRACRKVCPAGLHHTKTTSNTYFAEVAEQWDEIRSGYFTEHMRDAAIAKANIPAGAVVADVGTGTGFVAAGLAPIAGKVYGFDASAAMLAVARCNLAAYPNVELREAPGDQLPLPDETLDGVFANMFLHHAPQPPAAIREMARALKPGGVLCITDLDTHDHTWQRDAMADLWLGFERADIRQWLREAGLTEIDVDCAEGTCNACGPDGEVKPLSIFVAIGRKENGQGFIQCS